MTAPKLAYQNKLNESDFVADQAQQEALTALEHRYWQLINRDQQQALASLSSDQTQNQDLAQIEQKTQAQIKGLYMWGDVGRGKTFLMDIFYQGLPEAGKLRLHFHHFMAYVHQELRQISGQADPLLKVAKTLAQKYHLICFDEFFVSDIADAMILGQLFKGLFEQGVTLIATSNIPIQRLYWEGVQRQQFEQTIHLLETHCEQINLSGQEDHRLRHLEQDKIYYVKGEIEFETLFQQLNNTFNQDEIKQDSILVCKRQIPTVKQADKVVWFDFDSLCNSPRSQLDYIEIASRFHTILVSGVPALGGEVSEQIKARGTEDGSFEPNQTSERKISFAPEDDSARRFISLIDELYDSHKRLYLLADVALKDLYHGGALSFEFRRSISRLIEMQSTQYLASTR